MGDPERSSDRHDRRSLYGAHTPWGFLAILFVGLSVGSAVAGAVGVTLSLDVVPIALSVAITCLISRLVLFLRHRRR
ncbi:hypothetical protein [Rathayibacter sp. VKM Ac-2760]|uniref:hypothetical protein n=1 Tax=Rathayibacter sp. VKM Ac-2760 TaxID=2609253 RepID=UPI0013170236|nr:hypothetical protein [Rathayibacter sp. VKM Ac-2760]QHC58229.1 hypothetical protein GSU72_06420 [Rathayibacter sp. VKM Ac-2760]